MNKKHTGERTLETSNAEPIQKKPKYYMKNIKCQSADVSIQKTKHSYTLHTLNPVLEKNQKDFSPVGQMHRVTGKLACSNELLSSLRHRWGTTVLVKAERGQLG
jgi:hypothetical protein